VCESGLVDDLMKLCCSLFAPLVGQLLASSSNPQCPESLGVGSGGGAKAAGKVAEGTGPPTAGSTRWPGWIGSRLSFHGSSLAHVNQHWEQILFIYLFVVLGNELRVLCFEGNHTTTWAMPRNVFAFIYFLLLLLLLKNLW
jgi:hypothetical protein